MPVQKNKGSVLVKLGVVIVVLVVAGFFAYQQLQKVALVKLPTFETQVDAVTGTVAVDAEGYTRKLDSEASGKVKIENIKPGSKFKEGDILVELDDTEARRALDEADRQYNLGLELSRFALTGGKPELLADEKLTDEKREEILKEVNPGRKLAKEKWEYSRRLLDLGETSEEEFKTATRAVEDIDRELKLKVIQEKRTRDDYTFSKKSAEIQLEKMKIRAPIDGQIHEALTWKGALINNGTTVATFFSNKRLVAAKISEESFGKVRVGQKARVRLLGEQIFDGVVSELHPKADDVQRFTVYLNLKVENPEILNPGSTGEVTITVGEHPNALTIPRRALFDGDKVFVVKNGRVEKRTVKLGYVALNIAEIMEGVAKDEPVIVDRLELYRGGERVKTQVAK